MKPALLPIPAASEQGPLRILVADDNAILRAAVRGLLRRLGHSVEMATDGREAVEAAAREDFDFLFLDMQMPEMDGFEAARALRRVPTGLRRPLLIGLSAEGMDRESFEAAGFDDFLVKPIKLDDLIRILKYHSPI